EPRLADDAHDLAVAAPRVLQPRCQEVELAAPSDERREPPVRAEALAALQAPRAWRPAEPARLRQGEVPLEERRRRLVDQDRSRLRRGHERVERRPGLALPLEVDRQAAARRADQEAPDGDRRADPERLALHARALGGGVD